MGRTADEVTAALPVWRRRRVERRYLELKAEVEGRGEKVADQGIGGLTIVFSEEQGGGGIRRVSPS